jgi:hypothetical protein
MAVELLEKKYRRVPVPMTIDDLIRDYGLPTFQNDPRDPRRVIVDPEWLKNNLVHEWFPGIGQVTVHRHMVLPLYDALSEIDEGPDMDYIDSRQCGTWVPRRTLWKPGNRLSTHALGLALDINWDDNPIGKKPGTIMSHPLVIAAFKRQGFIHGADWVNRDSMHWQRMSDKISLPR